MEEPVEILNDDFRFANEQMEMVRKGGREPDEADLELEHFHKSCSNASKDPMDSGLFGFWLRFGSVTGFFKPAPSPKPRQKPKILAAHRYIFSVNALIRIPSSEGIGSQRKVSEGSKNFGW